MNTLDFGKHVESAFRHSNLNPLSS
jgi:hypothetical protein